MIYKDLVDDLISWWVKDKDGRLIQVNTKDDESGGVSFWINSWIRDEAIKLMSLEARSMKKSY